MFPDADERALQSALDASGGDIAATIDQLFDSPPPPKAAAPEPPPPEPQPEDDADFEWTEPEPPREEAPADEPADVVVESRPPDSPTRRSRAPPAPAPAPAPAISPRAELARGARRAAGRPALGTRPRTRWSPSSSTCCKDLQMIAHREARAATPCSVPRGRLQRARLVLRWSARARARAARAARDRARRDRVQARDREGNARRLVARRAARARAARPAALARHDQVGGLRRRAPALARPGHRRPRRRVQPLGDARARARRGVLARRRPLGRALPADAPARLLERVAQGLRGRGRAALARPARARRARRPQARRRRRRRGRRRRRRLGRRRAVPGPARAWATAAQGRPRAAVVDLDAVGPRRAGAATGRRAARGLLRHRRRAVVARRAAPAPSRAARAAPEPPVSPKSPASVASTASPFGAAAGPPPQARPPRRRRPRRRRARSRRGRTRRRGSSRSGSAAT